MSQLPSIGRVVQFRIGGIEFEPIYRPALVTAVADIDDAVNLVVTLDGHNDRVILEANQARIYAGDAEVAGSAGDWIARAAANCTLWVVRVVEGTAVGTWRWPPRV